MISVETASQLLDFGGATTHAPSRISNAQARAQLEGAVAIHNILETHRVAYLADEVGMGKTYIALGAFALFRHFNPDFRILVIAPKENIQHKWTKELRNFVRNNVRFADCRVKAIHDAPARSSILCNSLMGLVRETALDPDRDFFARLTSFSLGLSDDATAWRHKRDELLAAIPWLDEKLFDLRAKELFKRNFARGVCCALPVFDLVIIDEGHSLKHGLATKASRNQVLALTMGRDLESEETPRVFRGYGPRAKRVLLLSATPLEDDYRHVWNQLSVLGHQEVVQGLEDPDLAEEEKREILSRILIRRVNEVRVGGQKLTKNQYRREWRQGGVSVHDEPIDVPDERQQLVIALVQKKVSELLEHERFNHSFQIGMLASFESFLQTAKVRVSEESNFDDADQSDDALEREGLDVDSVNSLARSYRATFRQELPHPKMDALVEALRGSFETGEKALVFVRRVASVKELKTKLDAVYDEWLIDRLRSGVSMELRPRLDDLYNAYRTERLRKRNARLLAQSDGDDVPLDASDEPAPPPLDDLGGTETFFAWFFRGEGPPQVVSGAELAFRLNNPRYALSSLFLDNWVAAVLGVDPQDVLTALSAATRLPIDSLQSELGRIAGSVVPMRTRQTHRELFLAFQFAGLQLLHSAAEQFRAQAGAMIGELFSGMTHCSNRSLPHGTWLQTPTFFTELRKRPALRDTLWLHDANSGFVASFRRAELRRELIASMCRLGHSLIDLWTLYVEQTGRIDIVADRAEHDQAALINAFLDHLEKQRDRGGFGAYQELKEAADHFDLIVDTNAPSLWDRKLEEVPTELGQLLREQQPIGGMAGTVNRTLVRQFRMPGYPFALITTDLLQEGEDLHLFCSRVYHYGISWMPSSMEQRVGRVDRIRSQTERRLQAAPVIGNEDRLLQVFYPYLNETVEVFQVRRVFERLNRFMRLMHEGFGGAEDDRERRVDLRFEASRFHEVAPITELLTSLFPVSRELISGPRRNLAVDPKSERRIEKRFAALRTLEEELPIVWQPAPARSVLIGRLRDLRQQSFTLLLHSIAGELTVRCVSPIGRIDPRTHTDRITEAARSLMVRIGAVYDSRFKRYNLTAEGDVLLGPPSADHRRVRWLIDTVVRAADRLEEVLLQIDEDPAVFEDDLGREAEFER